MLVAGAAVKKRAKDIAWYDDLLREHGAIDPVVLENDEVVASREASLDRYGRGLRGRSKMDRAYDWHAFGYGTFPYLEGDDALARYRSVRGPVIAMNAYVHLPFVAARCSEPLPFDLAEGRRVAPPDVLV